ncbi:MAG: cupin domain-containing protein [Xanthomonadales bacterium]|jgi:quercetin dioxygenase-like cupin family protein|nr:cupin domain-containing protein [Xanthomonadales bacterium]MDH3925408.1 cupin domain-containing protein [Xanthomonadales bacterium]MDH4002688.1 cupin domain-containing protein [Xanthomonadales bacterium]
MAKAEFYKWQDIQREQLNPQLGRKMITGQNVMLTQIFLQKGCIVPRHSHHNEQVTYVLDGALKFLLGDDQEEEVIVRAGEVLVIPPNLPHSAEALEDTVDIDIFDPPREDWLDGSDSYLRDSDQ